MGVMMTKFGRIDNAGLSQAFNAITFGDLSSQVRAALLLGNTPDSYLAKEIAKYLKLSPGINPVVKRLLIKAKVKKMPKYRVIKDIKKRA